MTTHDVVAEAQWSNWTLLDGLEPYLARCIGETNLCPGVPYRTHFDHGRGRDHW
jgi:hypothetical protein